MKEPVKLTINNEEYYFINIDRDNPKYRHSFNNLTRKTYGFDFEEWYQQGYWSDKYLPYSLLHNDEVVANVSANTIDFLFDGKLLHTVQIGTVMTEEAYRKKGLSKLLINKIIEEYEGQCDLMYLYANDTVLEFYTKYGFVEAEEYSYLRQFVKRENRLSSRKLDMKSSRDKQIITRLVAATRPVSKISMIGNSGLDMFCLISFMSNDIYYIEELDLAVVVDFDGDNMFFMDVFCEQEFDLDEVINSLMNKAAMKVTLGFTPLDSALYTCEILKEEGTTFFIRGKNTIEKGRFPILSHA